LSISRPAYITLSIVTTGQLDRLEEQILSLDKMPERYRKYEKEPWKSRGLRVLPVDNYLVLYIPDNDKKVVTILRVMSSDNALISTGLADGIFTSNGRPLCKIICL